MKWPAVVVLVLVVSGWVIGAAGVIGGLGFTLVEILRGEFFGVIQGVALTMWGVVVLQPAIFGAGSFTRTILAATKKP